MVKKKEGGGKVRQRGRLQISSGFILNRVTQSPRRSMSALRGFQSIEKLGTNFEIAEKTARRRFRYGRGRHLRETSFAEQKGKVVV